MVDNLFNQKRQGMLLKSLLKLKYSAIAVSFGKKPPNSLRKLAGKMEFCRMWVEAQKGKSFFVAPEKS